MSDQDLNPLSPPPVKKLCLPESGPSTSRRSTFTQSTLHRFFSTSKESKDLPKTASDHTSIDHLIGLHLYTKEDISAAKGIDKAYNNTGISSLYGSQEYE